MKNTGKTVKVAILLLVLCMISTAMLGGTFAKYTSEYAGQDTALVAKWSFTGHFNDESLNGTNIPLKIWDHDYSKNIYQQVDANNYLIAPGVGGSFKIDFAYDADVDASLIFNFTKSGVGATKVPIQYSLDSDFTDYYYSLDDLEDAIIDKAVPNNITGSDGSYVITNTSTTGTVNINQTVYWRWPYNVEDHDDITLLKAAGFTGTGTGGAWTDADDTAAGISLQAPVSRDEYVLNLQIRATQIEPTLATATSVTAIGQITGTAKVGSTLTAGALIPAGATVTYQWKRSDTVGGPYSNIAGANGSTYTLDDEDANKYIVVTAIGSGDYKGSATSPVTAKIAP